MELCYLFEVWTHAVKNLLLYLNWILTLALIITLLSFFTKPVYFTRQTRLDSQSNESYVTISTLQAEKTELIQVKDSMLRYIRELEQINDDLERGKRYVSYSLLYIVVGLALALIIHPPWKLESYSTSNMCWLRVKGHNIMWALHNCHLNFFVSKNGVCVCVIWQLFNGFVKC